MEIINPNYLNLPEQVQKNKNDIKELFERGLFNYKGEWNSNTIYSKNDCVKYNNTLYIYKLDVSSQGIIPTNTIYWDIFQQDTGTLVKDINGNSLSQCEFSGHNGINIDMDEYNPNDFNIRLDNEITNKLDRTLVVPLSAPSEDEFVLIGDNNAQKLENVSQVQNKLNNMVTPSQGQTITGKQSSVVESYLNGTTGYIIFSNGFKVVWTRKWVSDIINNEVELPISFSDTNYSVICTANINNGYPNIATKINSVSNITVRSDIANNNIYIVCMGY